MIRQLDLHDFRNYSELSIAFPKMVNVFIGRNGQGKTNLLEALFFLGMLRSFRTAGISDLKRIGSQGFSIHARLASSRVSWQQKLAIEYADTRKLKIDESPVKKASEFIGQFRTVVFTHYDILLATGSAALRRRFLDMTATSLHPEYLTILNDYVAALRMRNAAIRKEAGSDLSLIRSFEPILAKNGSMVINYRQRILSELSIEVEKIIRQIHGRDVNFKINYSKQGLVSGEEQYLAKLNQQRNRDLQRGYTTFGPQQDDYDLVLEQQPLRNFGSTGQCRLLSLAIKMAKIVLLDQVKTNDSGLIVLVDDVTGELDEATKNAFFRMVGKADQIFYTSTEKPDFLGEIANAEVFKVAGGKILPEA